MNARAENTPETPKAPSPDTPNAKSTSVPSAARQEPTPVADAAAANPQPNSEAAAESAYQQAQTEYAKNDVKGALESMRESFRLSQRPELLYNLAMLERELQQCQPALDDYSSYLQHVPKGQYRDEAVQARLALTRECPALAQASVAAPGPALLSAKGQASVRVNWREPPRTNPESRYWTAPRAIGWSAVVAGVLAGGGALYFTLAASSAKSAFQHSVDAHRTGGLPDLGLQDTQHGDQRAAQVLAVSGSALIAGGVLILLFGPRDSQQAGAQAQILVQPGCLEAGLTQHF